MSSSSSSSKSLHFDAYRFGEQVDMASTSLQSVSPRSSLQHSRSHSSLSSPFSPMQGINPQQQEQEQYVQPLTRGMLEKKDRLDMLLQNRPTPGVGMIQRRRSICNGNIYRQLYNEDNSPMTLATPFTKMDSEDSDASVNSPNSQYNARLHRPYSGQHARHHLKAKHHHQHHGHVTSHVPPSIELTNRSDTNRNRSYGSITNKKQSTNSRSVNTSHASSNSYHALSPDVSGPPRRFSGLVRLSAAHIALNRTRKSKKQRHYQSTVSIIFHKLKIMASRVVNSRISEPADTKMSIEELTSLSRYLDVLRHGYIKDNKSDSDDMSTDGVSTPATSKQPPIIGLFVEEEPHDENSNGDQDSTGPNEHNDETSPLLLSPSKSKKKRNLSSLGNIFPFAPLDRIPSISRSGSESSQINAESDRLLPPPSPQQTRASLLSRSQKKSYHLDKMARYIQHLWHPILHFQQYHQHQQEHNTQIRFEGWSLFLFSPTSLTRLYLWKIVGARQLVRGAYTVTVADAVDINVFCACLVQQRSRPVYEDGFELASKITVYGLISNTHSTTKPSLNTWFDRIRHRVHRRPSFRSVVYTGDIESVSSGGGQDDTASNYICSHHRHHLLPSFAHTPGSVSSAASIPSGTGSDRVYPNRHTSLSLSGSEPPSPSSVSPAATTDNTNPSLIDDLESIYNQESTHSQGPHLPLPNKRHRTRMEEVDSEDAKSILSAAEHQVLASLNPCSHHHNTFSADTAATADVDADIDFLKVTHKSFLSSLPNVIDLISVASYWIDLAIVLYLGRRPYPVFQALAATRLLRLLVITEGTTVIMTSLSSSYDMLKNVMGFFVFFWLLFSLAALFIFMNAFSRRCAVWPEDGLGKNLTNIQYVEPRISCSGYMISANERTGPYDVNTGTQNTHPAGDGLFCKLGQVCIQDVANQPEYGYMSYENILYTMLNILTVISTENWTDLLYITQDSVSELGAAIFYSFCIYLMTFIMVPMFIAVITTSFSHVRGDMRESAFSSKRKARLLLASGKRHKTRLQEEHEDEDHEEWIYEGIGLGGHRQTRSWIRGWAHFITHHAYFPYVGSILVVLNVFSMMFYNANMPAEDQMYYDLVNRIYTCIFALEIIIRIYGCLYWRQFWMRIRNRVDLIIVIATVADEFPFVRESKYHLFLLVFSVCRSYRIAYLFPGVLRLLSDVIGDGQGIMNLTFFTFLVLLLLSPMSVQLFGGDFKFVPEDEPSMRFDNWYQAFLALFQIMTGENWTDILYDAMHSQEGASVSYAAIYMIFIYFTVHYMVLNLFIAVIMENFDLDEEEIKQIQIKKYIREHRWKPEYFKMDTISRLLLPLFIIQDEKKLDFKSIPQNLVAQVTSSRFKDFLGQEASSSGSSSRSEPSLGRTSKSLSRFSLFEHNHPSRFFGKRPSSLLSHKSGISTRRPSAASQYSSRSLRLETASIAHLDHQDEPLVKYSDEYELNVARENKAVIVENLNVFRSIIILKKDNLIRKVCTHLAAKSSYNWFIVGLICISTLLALWADESNREQHPVLIRTVIGPLHALLLLIYWVDIFIHMVADGVFMLPKSYLRNAWNLFDMVNLTGQLVLTILMVNNANLPEKLALYGGYLRVLRTLRSMRIVYYVHGMRVIFLDLVYGLPKMIDAVALNFLVFVPFAIYGCFLFSGRFFICNDDNVGSKQACLGEFPATDDDNDGILLPRTWQNPYDYSFDTFGMSLLHLFECASGEGWILSLFSAMSVIPEDRDLQPQFSWSASSIFHSLYYVVFMFVASLCSIQLFIGVFLEIFKQRSGISSLTNTQRQFQDLQRQLALVKPSRKAERPPDGSFRAMCYDLVIDKRGKFAQFMAAVLTANIIVFATEHLHQPLWLGHVQDVLNAACLSLYVFEMGAKIAGLGLYKWASARWNIYDMVLFGWDVSRKLCLVGIAFRLAQRNESLDTLFRSVKRALPSIFFVSSVFFIVIVCFGVAFQEQFSSTRYGPYGNDHANFRSLFNTILTLFRITTGENWDFLMHDFTVLPPECVGKDDCGFPNYAIFLFISFYVVCTYIFVNLFTVIVIDNFSFTFDKRNQFTLITRTDLRHFKKAWSMLDPRATGYMGVADVPNFLSRLDGVLSIHIYEKEHYLSTLLEASNQIDGDAGQLIAVPLSYAKGANNTMGERFFNLHEFNKRLANIDTHVIKERKRQYAEVYQEILNTASHRGIAFHQMLEILAIRLVDVSKSLTFDELVNRARIQDKVANCLATERAKGLVNMVIQRRQFLKNRRKARNSQVLNHKNSSSIVGNWLRPSSRLPSPNREQSNPFLQLDPFISKSAQSRSKSESPNRQRGVPRIVVDPARQQSLDSIQIADPGLLSQQQSLRLPDRFANPVNRARGMPQRRNSTAIVPITLGAPPARRSSMIPQQTASPTPSIPSSEEICVPPPKISARRATAISIRRMSLAADILGCNTNAVSKNTADIATLGDTEDDVFTQYYSIDSTLNAMTSPDAKKIVHKFEHNAWSDLLHNEVASDD
ncbi:cation channel family protein [Mucor ambiguus]|uniref:Cation channel family protein n=1 Tax=Mucor ambiguus TaxID=91626 RepID=A0A0C9MM28_9FUNG|nr:cation channel family protein [Mucor ambiguus]